ncbi:hypothetical protein DPM19_12550 [Actinomadura craniellae]|uniref:DUF4333 domain-containing protein n=2 Tax=Actinomadura craniellae TaxID=2231787 RepID=A0A365H8K4_9ACTN|nr:hypothetical protein DPM19_12550 [Actinomadura craniellae]
MLAALLALTGCSEVKSGFEQGKREGMIEVLGAAAIAEAAGIPVSGDLTCTVQPPTGGDDTPVSCTGRTTNGKVITLTGTITEAAEVTRSDWMRGDFTATVAGAELFRRNCIGAC